MRILLTGCSGFIGQRLVESLLADGHELVCAVRRRNISERAGLAYIDVDFASDTDKSVSLARLDGIDAVINTVGIFRETAGQTFAALHTGTPRALFAACAESPGVALVVQVSALGADSDASTAYHLSTKAADDFLAALPLRSCIVQPSLVYGPGGASARAFKTLASVPICVRFGSAPQLVQPVHVDDVAAAIAAVLRDPARTPARIALVGPAPMEFTGYLVGVARGDGNGQAARAQLAGLGSQAGGEGGALSAWLVSRRGCLKHAQPRQ
ncbi:NAD-dependent epimerase/dehydratase family protein [Massilia sp. TWR1-2-2]|uniref:NAD-dependent epimerase/dehydratase family protein n=1 Tax=Massilia sp. TWR1-2-2 TaxID=2804584 RepID=UPI003CFA9A09